MGDRPTSTLPDSVPLFPLPTVVLFPRAVLPLHIFEERYKAMTALALKADGLIAMALLRPGWERDYYCRPEIEPVVCVGKILTHEKLPDGKYNFLLQGQVRARIVREVGGEPFRRAKLEPLTESKLMEIDLDGERRRLARLLEDPAVVESAVGRQMRLFLDSGLPTDAITDLMAFTFIDDIALQQSLLADGDVHRRVGRAVDAIGRFVSRAGATLTGNADDFNNARLN